MQTVNVRSVNGPSLTKNRMDRYIAEGGRFFAENGNTKRLNIIRFVAYVFDSANRKKNRGGAMSYEDMKEATRVRIAERSLLGRDIGELPKVVNPERKAQCERDFQQFCESYFPETFADEWSEDHLKVIHKIEAAVLDGGLFALAMPRGSGKSSLTETAALWSMLYGHRAFVTLIGSTEAAAVDMLGNIKTELEINDQLLDDFPEVVFPIRALDGISNRCNGQLYQGKRTRITWTNDEIVLPAIEGSNASGTIVKVAGITGNIRGMRHKRPDGSSIRPSLVIVDDPQTRESACSIEQTRKRLRVLSGDILGLAGPGQKISGIMPCTVIQIGDLADQILDREKHPEWNGERMKMLYEEPTNKKLWEKYAEIRAESLRTEGNIEAATAFYIKHRVEMDKGAVVAWKSRFVEGEVSAIQHAMNLKLQDATAFEAEYQNSPLPEAEEQNTALSVDGVCSKVNGLPFETVPQYCDRLTMFIDVQKLLLFYAVVAWREDFTGAVVDYGTFPGQVRDHFTLADAMPNLESVYPDYGLEARIYTGLKELTGKICGREYCKEDGSVLRIERGLIDANWGQSTDTVYQFCRESMFSNILLPSHGRYIGADSKPMHEYRKKAGMRLGFNWFMPIPAGRGIRHIIFDSNFWKSFLCTRLQTSLGDNGSLSLYGRSPERHELLAQHLTAEYRVRTIGRNREVDEWKIKPNHFDNHWLDCLSGCAVAASVTGCELPEAKRKADRTAETAIRLSALQKKNVLSYVSGTSAPQGSLKLSELQKRKRS